MIVPLAAAFVLGVLVTVAEPDLTVLAQQAPAIPGWTLILTVSAGVGLFLAVALLRVMRRIPLSRLPVAMAPPVDNQLLGLAGRVRKRLADDALKAELAKVEDCVLYYD